MSRWHAWALGIGIGIGVLALFLTMNRVLVVSSPAAEAATGATSKPTAHSKRTRPPEKKPTIGSGGKIFSGADTKDPRIQHFSN